MPSLIKQHILRPLAVFAKNLDPDQINLSALKGEVNMENLELNEEVLMDLLDFPTWMKINSAVCSKISVKIPWTNLRSKPISMVIDDVNVKVEVLGKPRHQSSSGSSSSYRSSSGRYGLVDRAIDGISLHIHELSAEMTSKVFRASVILSQITLRSKKPNWESGPLNTTFIPLPERNSILIFKEASWESTQFKADGLDDRMTPVKVITNRAHLRVVLKKRLSDSSFVCGKITFLIESLLWVLTVSQLEAAIVFLKFMKRSMELASGINLFKMKPTVLGSSAEPVAMSTNRGISVVPHSSDPRIVKAFDYYDIMENSIHLEASLIEIHFCEDNLRTSSMSTQLVEGGFVRLILKHLNFDHYPAHPKVAPRKDWADYLDIDRARSKWLQSLKPQSDPDSFINSRLNNPKMSSIFQSVVVFRLRDITVACVLLDNQEEEERWPLLSNIAKRHKRRTVLEALNGEQNSLMSNTFIASDTLMHKLPVKANLIAVDFTQCLSSDSPNTVLPLILFAQINPLHIKFDVDTIIWFNAFLLNLTTNMQTLFAETEDLFEQQTAPPLFCRAEALMPRVIFPMFPPPRNADSPATTEYPWTGPSALVFQIDMVMIQTVPRPVTAPMAKSLAATVDTLQKQLRPPPAWGRDRVPPDFPLFRRFIEQDPLSMLSGKEPDGLLICLHCPTVWAEFLTICEVAHRHSSENPLFKTYRQAFFDPSPFTCWALAPSWPLWSRPPSAPRHSVTWSPDIGRDLTSPPSLPAPVSILIDFDTYVNPISVHASSSMSYNLVNRSKPLHFTIGHSGAVFTFHSVELLRLPDAVDHLLFLYGLAFRLARLKASMALDTNDFMAKQGENGEVKRYHEWLFTAKCLLTHGVEVEVASTVDSRFIHPPSDFEVNGSETRSSLSSSSLAKTLESSSKPAEVDASGCRPSNSGVETDKNSFSSDPFTAFGCVLQSDQTVKASKSSGLLESYSGVFKAGSLLSLNSDGSLMDDSNVLLAHSDSFEILLPDAEAFSEVFGNSFDEIIPDEMGVDVANSGDIEEHSNTVIDEEQAANFPPWKVQRLMLNLKGISIDADVTTVEARLWVGIGSVNFFDPDEQLSDDPPDENGAGDIETKSDISDVSTPLSSSPAFFIKMRFGGDALPGQPPTLLSPYDGWMAVYVGMMEETTLYPVRTFWKVLEALLGHLTSRGGVRACNRVITLGPGAGSMPLRNPPQLLDLSFCLEKGNLVLDLTARSGKWVKKSRKDDTLVQGKGKAPIQEIKLLQGFSASLNSEGVLEVCGALPIMNLATSSTPSRSPSISFTSPNNTSSPPVLPARSTPSASALASSLKSPSSRGSPLPRRPNGPMVPDSEASLVEENAKLRLMVERLNAQVMALTMDLTRFKTRYSS